MGQLIVTLVLLGNGAELSPDALARYQKANASITAAQYPAAIQELNALTAEYPRVAELFAARCSALIAVKNYPAAEADCNYAISVKPTLGAARYGLATALDYQGKRDAAVASYRQYAAMDEKAAPYKAAAASRADALAAAPAAPPMVAAGTVEGGEGKLVVYKNHVGSVGRLMLVLDGKLVGDLSMDEYVEIEVAPGEHLLEARTYPPTVYDAPRTWTRPVRTGGATVYLNFDTKGGSMVMQEVSASLARTDIRNDCKKAYSRQINAESVQAPVPQQQQVVVGGPAYGYGWPGGGVVVVSPGAGSGARPCRFSSDCGSGNYSCRNWNGQNVCMGYGNYGSPCWFSSDCLSNSCDISNKVCR